MNSVRVITFDGNFSIPILGEFQRDNHGRYVSAGPAKYYLPEGLILEVLDATPEPPQETPPEGPAEPAEEPQAAEILQAPADPVKSAPVKPFEELSPSTQKRLREQKAPIAVEYDKAQARKNAKAAAARARRAAKRL